MRKRAFEKMIALVLCTVLTFSVTSTAFATGPSEVSSDSIDEAVIAGLNNVVLVEDINVSNSDTIILDPMDIKMYALGSLEAKQVVRIQAKWTPISEVLMIGIISTAASENCLYRATNGAVDIIRTVPADGEYYLMMMNLSPASALIITGLNATVYEKT